MQSEAHQISDEWASLVTSAELARESGETLPAVPAELIFRTIDLLDRLAEIEEDPVDEWMVDGRQAPRIPNFEWLAWRAVQIFPDAADTAIAAPSMIATLLEQCLAGTIQRSP